MWNQARPGRSVFGALVSGSLLVLSPSVAAGDASGDPAVSKDERAAYWLAEGNRAYRLGKFDEAERSYRQAFALRGGYDIAGNLGMVELAEGKYRDAATHLALTVRLFPLTGDPGLRDRIQHAFAEAQAKVFAVRLTVSQEGARVEVDGATVGHSPLGEDIFLEPGEHRIVASLEGHLEASRTVVARAGEALEARLDLVAKPKDPATYVGMPPKPPPSRSVVPGIALGVSSVVGFGVGAALYADAESKHGDATILGRSVLAAGKSCVTGATNGDLRCSNLRGEANSYVGIHNASVITFVASGAVATAAAIDLLWPRLSLDPPKIGWAPSVGPGVAGVHVSVSF